MKNHFTIVLLAFGLVQAHNASAQKADVIPARMKAALAEDSIQKNESYFFRINKVKVVTEKQEGDKTIREIDRYGHETSSKWWLNGKLFSLTEWTYDEYGNWTLLKDTYYEDNGELESVYISTRMYELMKDGMSERHVHDKTLYKGYEDGSVSEESKWEETYEYDSAGRVARTVEWGTHAYCSGGPESFRKVTLITYSASGQELRHDIVSTGGCDGDYTSTVEYTYSQDGRSSTVKTFKNGELLSSASYGKNEQGQDVSYISRKNGEVSFVLIWEYYPNGLTRLDKTYFMGRKEREKYSYEYYE